MGTKKPTPPKNARVNVESAPDIEKRRRLFQGVASGEVVSVAPSAERREQVRRRSRIVSIVTIAVVVVVSIAALAVYSLWHQSANKTVADAFYNTLSASSIQFSAKVSSPTREVASIDGRMTGERGVIDASMKTTLPDDLSTIHFSAVTTPNDIFLRLPKASQILATNASPAQATLLNALLPIVQQDIDNKWVYVQSNELPYVQSITRLSTCMVQSLQLFSTSHTARLGFMNAYEHNAFMDAKKIRAKDTEAIYQVTIKQRPFLGFLDELSAEGKAVPLGACDELKSLRTSTLHDAVLDVAVDPSSRQLIRLGVAIPGDSPLAITATFATQGVQVVSEPPEVDTVRFRDIKNKILGIVPANPTGE
ncbi:MAG: hypothetical protein WAS27_00850 [Candidatus Saccharimonadales bacterium]